MTALNKHSLQLLGIAKTWACKSLAGWDDAVHRDLLARHGAVALPGTDGRVSGSSMTPPQIEAALADYEARGWQRQRRQFAQAVHTGHGGNSTQRVVQAVPERIAHIVRLWGRLGTAGKVQSATRAALLAWCERQVMHTVPNLDALTVPECQRITEALKGWLGRA
jgi:hypothetical protein